MRHWELGQMIWQISIYSLCLWWVDVSLCFCPSQSATCLESNKDSRVLWTKDDLLLTTGFNMVRNMETHGRVSRDIITVKIKQSNSVTVFFKSLIVWQHLKMSVYAQTHRSFLRNLHKMIPHLAQDTNTNVLKCDKCYFDSENLTSLSCFYIYIRTTLYSVGRCMKNSQLKVNPCTVICFIIIFTSVSGVLCFLLSRCVASRWSCGTVGSSASQSVPCLSALPVGEFSIQHRQQSLTGPVMSETELHCVCARLTKNIQHMCVVCGLCVALVWWCMDGEASAHSAASSRP